MPNNATLTSVTVSQRRKIRTKILFLVRNERLKLMKSSRVHTIARKVEALWFKRATSLEEYYDNTSRLSFKKRIRDILYSLPECRGINHRNRLSKGRITTRCLCVDIPMVIEKEMLLDMVPRRLSFSMGMDEDIVM